MTRFLMPERREVGRRAARSRRRRTILPCFGRKVPLSATVSGGPGAKLSESSHPRSRPGGPGRAAHAPGMCGNGRGELAGTLGRWPRQAEGGLGSANLGTIRCRKDRGGTAMTEGSHGAESPARILGLLAMAGLLWGCSSSAGVMLDAGTAKDMAGPDAFRDADGTRDADAATDVENHGDANAADTGAADSGSTPDTASSAPGNAGNPNASCSAGVPAAGRAVDTSTPTTVVGTGTADGCTFAALKAAVAKAGIITFDCGDDPVTIRVTSTLNLVTTKDTVIDGGRKVTLDGGNAVQILNFTSANFQANDHGLTLQHLALANGKMTPTQAIPTAPFPCSQGFDDGEGGALYMRDGNLTIIDCIFTGNQAAQLGPDTGGGALYVLGSKRGTVIVGSTFRATAAATRAPWPACSRT